MSRIRAGILGLGLALAACEGREPPKLEPPAADAATPAAVPDLNPYLGQSFTTFAAVPEMNRYTLDELGLSAAEQARFRASMATQIPGAVAEGGGVKAFVLGGCAVSGCGDGAALLAIDLATGAPFVGVRDGAGAAVLIPNDRIEALLRINAPSRRWDDPEGWHEPPEASAQP